jgi:hypothetical protein
MLHKCSANFAVLHEMAALAAGMGGDGLRQRLAMESEHACYHYQHVEDAVFTFRTAARARAWFHARLRWF